MERDEAEKLLTPAEARALRTIRMVPNVIFGNFVRRSVSKVVDTICAEALTGTEFRVYESRKEDELWPCVIGTSTKGACLALWKYGEYYKELEPLFKIRFGYRYYYGGRFVVNIAASHGFNEEIPLDPDTWPPMRLVIGEIMKARATFSDFEIPFERQLARLQRT